MKFSLTFDLNRFIPILLGFLLIISSACSVTKRRYAAGWHVEWHKRVNSNQVPLRSKNATTNDQLATKTEEKKCDVLLHPVNTESEMITTTSAIMDEVVLSDTLEITPNRATTTTQPADVFHKHKKCNANTFGKQPYKVKNVLKAERKGVKKRFPRSNGVLIIVYLIGSLP